MSAPDLTPVRAHYLKKSLVLLQLRTELHDLTAAPADNASALAHLGPPFAPPRTRLPRLDLPLLRYCFRHFVLSFPFLAAAPNDFYSDKLQPFVDSVLARNLSPSLLDDSDPQDPAPRKLISRIERNLAMFLTSAIKLHEPEDVLRLSQADLRSLERAVNKRLAKHATRSTVFHVNIVSVRTVTDRGRVRSRVHEVCTPLLVPHSIRAPPPRSSSSAQPSLMTDKCALPAATAISGRLLTRFVLYLPPHFPSHTFQLRKAHPDSIVPPPPPKDRTAVDVSIPSDPAFSPESSLSDSLAQDPYVPGSFYATQANGEHTPPRLSREKNRLTLRAYLHTLLATPPFSSSPVLRSFLFSGPTRLSPQEQEDAQRREEADRVREQGRKEFARQIGARVDQLREAVSTVKGEIVGKGNVFPWRSSRFKLIHLHSDGLSHVFAIIKTTPHVRQLPENYQAVLEWARISSVYLSFLPPPPPYLSMFATDWHRRYFRRLWLLTTLQRHLPV